MQRAIPQLFITSTPVPGMMYSAVAKARFPAIPTRKVFGRDTEDESVYKKILAALDTVSTTLFNHIESALGYGEEQNVCRLCHWILVRAKKFVEEMFKYMDITCRKLEIALNLRRNLGISYATAFERSSLRNSRRRETWLLDPAWTILELQDACTQLSR